MLQFYAIDYQFLVPFCPYLRLFPERNSVTFVFQRAPKQRFKRLDMTQLSKTNSVVQRAIALFFLFWITGEPFKIERSQTTWSFFSQRIYCMKNWFSIQSLMNEALPFLTAPIVNHLNLFSNYVHRDDIKIKFSFSPQQPLSWRRCRCWAEGQPNCRVTFPRHLSTLFTSSCGTKTIRISPFTSKIWLIVCYYDGLMSLEVACPIRSIVELNCR